MMKHCLPALAKFLTSLILILFSLSTFAQEISKDAAVIKVGEDLFNGNCKSCHRVKQKLVGPALAGVYDRAPSIGWIKSWIRNSAKVVASGDAYAVALYNEYNKSQMTAFNSYTDDQIMSILAYVKAEADKPDVIVDPKDPNKPTEGSSISSTYLNAIVIGMVLILVLLVIILALIISALKKYLDQKELSDEDKEVVHSPITVTTFFQSKGFIFVVVFLVASISFKTVIDGLYTVGIQQGYQPKQPIAFSHKLHAILLRSRRFMQQ
jgi:mono/diheme cytochrome c family protein